MCFHPLILRQFSVENAGLCCCWCALPSPLCELSFITMSVSPAQLKFRCRFPCRGRFSPFSIPPPLLLFPGEDQPGPGSHTASPPAGALWSPSARLLSSWEAWLSLMKLWGSGGPSFSVPSHAPHAGLCPLGPPSPSVLLCCHPHQWIGSLALQPLMGDPAPTLGRGPGARVPHPTQVPGGAGDSQLIALHRTGAGGHRTPLTAPLPCCEHYIVRVGKKYSIKIRRKGDGVWFCSSVVDVPVEPLFNHPEHVRMKVSWASICIHVILTPHAGALQGWGLVRALGLNVICQWSRTSWWLTW